MRIVKVRYTKLLFYVPSTITNQMTKPHSPLVGAQRFYRYSLKTVNKVLMQFIQMQKYAN